jgi:hypothetical protein
MRTQNFILVDTSGSMWPKWDNVKSNLIELDNLLEDKLFVFTNSEVVFTTRNLNSYLKYIEPSGLTNFVLTLEGILGELKVGKGYNIHLFTDNCGKVKYEDKVRITTRLKLINNQSNVTFYGVSDLVKCKLGLDALELDSINFIKNSYVDQYKQTSKLLTNLYKTTSKEL